MKDKNGLHVVMFRCEKCGHPICSVRAAENVSTNGCPVCSCKLMEAVPLVEEDMLAIPAYEVVQLQAHLARREARNA